MKKLILAILLVITSVMAFADTHQVQKGESLQSIAEKYNITVGQLIDANPGSEKLFYVGMKLNIPEAKSIDNPTGTNMGVFTQSESGESTTVKQSYNMAKNKEQAEEEITVFDFNHAFVSYTANFDMFDKGAYGIGYVVRNDKGWGAVFGINSSYGLVKEGVLIGELGVSYGHIINKSFLIGSHLVGFMRSRYDKQAKKNIDTGGMLLKPHFEIKVNKFVFSVGYNVGWGTIKKLYENNKTKNSVKIQHDFQATVGYCM